MFVYQAHFLVAVIRLIGNSDNQESDIRCSIVLSFSLSFLVALTLEHRASLKRFVSLQFLNPKTFGRTPRTGISPSQGHYLHSTTQTQNKRIQISMP
jgi:hypothetical protein